MGARVFRNVPWAVRLFLATQRQRAEQVAIWWNCESRAGSPGFGSVLSALFGDGVQSPLAGDALEFVLSAVLETDPRSGYEILDRA